MNFSRRSVGNFLGRSLLLLLISGLSSCEEQPKKVTKTVTFECKDQIVTVDAAGNANPPSVYVCEDDTVTWQLAHPTFTIEFTGESPFKDNKKTFHNNEKSGRAKHEAVVTVYPYQIDGKEGDPQVIGGGGH